MFDTLKPRPNHAKYIEVLRAMTPEQRLLKAFELSDMVKQLFLQGLRERYPDVTEERFHEIVLERLARISEQELEIANRGWQP